MARTVLGSIRMGRRVLVADDDQDLLDLVTACLVRSGLEVVQATTGADLLEQVAEHGPFDLVITDVAMPWMTGFQAAACVREAGLDIPVLVMTGRTDPSLPDRVRALGTRARLLRKPFNSAQLTDAVRDLIG